MPHSSGGGSHGGGYSSSSSSRSYSSGSHGGGYSSSSSSYSSGSRSYSSSSSSGIYTRPRPGARRYVYYNPRTDRQENFYVSGTPSKPSTGGAVGVFLFWTIVAALLIWLFVYVGVESPRALDLSSYNSDLVLIDTTGLITPEDNKKLTVAMTNFQLKTGVTPAIEVVFDSSWEGHYTDMETFALSEYLRLFDDEKHWLFVISYPKTFATDEFVDWRWQSIAGDDIGPAIPSSKESVLGELVQKYMLRAEPEQLGSAMSNALTEFSQTAMETHVYGTAVFFVIVILLIWGAVTYSIWEDYTKSYKVSKAIAQSSPSPSKATGTKVRENTYFTCEYCGRSYASGKGDYCPGCGAPVSHK